MNNTVFAWAIALVFGYLLGSLNLSVIVSRFVLGHDVREFGSHNAGSTNMLRTFGWKIAIPVFLGDIVKGALAVLVGAIIFSHFGETRVLGSYISAAGALVGHMYPVFFGFRGGKGVAIAIGMIIALHPIQGVTVLAIGFGIAALTGYVSAGSVICALLYLPVAIIMGGTTEFFPSVVMVALILYGHRANIRRLLRHEENKFIPPKM